MKKKLVLLSTVFCILAVISGLGSAILSLKILNKIAVVFTLGSIGSFFISTTTPEN